MATKTKNKINIIGLKELRLNTEKYINRLGNGESFTVVRRSRPVFNMVPFDEDDNSLWETVVDFRQINKGGVSAEKVYKMIKKFNEQNP